MTIKCQKCGNECYNHDKFCSQCGAKLNTGDISNIKVALEQFETNEKMNFDFKGKASFKSEKVKKIFENALVNVVVFLIALLCAFSFVMFFILDNHQDKNDILRYKNYMENPAVIPMLKEPQNYLELSSNIKEVVDFLKMYLKNTSDNQDKKNQIFASFLKH